jgi:rhamnogalacturonyl hydrolase YesR
MNRKSLFIPIILLRSVFPVIAQEKPEEYTMATPYGGTTAKDIKSVLDRVFSYVDSVTPAAVVNKRTGDAITNLTQPVVEATLKKTEYNITSHEWGLCYTSLIAASNATGDHRYSDYVADRLQFLSKAAPYFRTYHEKFPSEPVPLNHFLFPRSLDDTGSMCAAMIQSLLLGKTIDLRPEIDRSINFIMSGVHRLKDGTFARNSPMPNSVWVDDLYQGIPALAAMGKLTGDQKYYDEASKQVSQFLTLLFNLDMGVCKHGLVEGMVPHPAFYWARANGWAIMAITSLLDVLPAEHPRRPEILRLYRAYCLGLARLQSASGFWHQLLDRNDSFLETSATAMFTYAIAHGINERWLDHRAFGPQALLGWNAVSTKVNKYGQVEGTSAGTSMAFDAAFYYRRPVGTGPHGYGSVLLAGAAMYKLLQEHPYSGSGPVLFTK